MLTCQDDTIRGPETLKMESDCSSRKLGETSFVREANANTAQVRIFTTHSVVQKRASDRRLAIRQFASGASRRPIGAGREGPALRVCHAFAARDREKEAAVNVIFPLRLLEMQ